jgi:hypothetical protein
LETPAALLTGDGYQKHIDQTNMGSKSLERASTMRRKRKKKKKKEKKKGGWRWWWFQ